MAAPAWRRRRAIANVQSGRESGNLNGRDAAIQARRDYAGPVILQQGFRPFFLGGCAWAAGAVALWMAVRGGAIELPSAFDPLTWHSHEMIFGFVAAAVAGFLLTAVPNWTGRLPARGAWLGLLFALWCAGRVAVALSDLIGPVLGAALDLAFPAALCALILREIAAGKNWRNLPVAVLIAVFGAANLLVHLEVLGVAPSGAAGLRLGIAAMAFLMSLIGGRIVPSFTGNWLAKRNETVLPRPFGRLDRVTLAVTALAGIAWTLAPDWPVTGVVALLAGLALGMRLSRWRGQRTLAEPLVWVLHLGYGWLAVGFALLGVAVLVPGFPQTAALHALTAGAMGTMTLAVMTRATLGHTGRALRAGVGTTALYGLVTASAVLRILAPALPLAGFDAVLLVLAGLCWIGAFGLFVVLYGPLLVRPRRAGHA
jgi:uncharacterized protein involved in response to NO